MKSPSRLSTPSKGAKRPAVVGRSWYQFKRAARVRRLADLRVGKPYLMSSHHGDCIALNVIWVTGRSICPVPVVYWNYFLPNEPFRAAGPNEGVTAAVHGYEVEALDASTAYFEIDPRTINNPPYPRRALLAPVAKPKILRAEPAELVLA